MNDAPAAFNLVVLVIIDGFGWRDATIDNAIKLATKPHYDALWAHGPRGFLRACGPDVGLTDGQVGDSEVGHRTLGAGRPVWKNAPARLRNLLGDVIADAGLAQIRIATEERVDHVTRLFEGGAGRGRHISAIDLAEETAAAITSGTAQFILVNIGDADAAGHTGDLALAVAAVERVDAILGRIAEAVVSVEGAMIVTSDHGNCETMRDPLSGAPHCGHTANDVPVILMAPGHYFFRDGTLADVAPTVLKLLGLPKPREMSGSALHRGSWEADESHGH